MHPDYKLIYWPLPFRGSFVLSLLEYRQCRYELSPVEEVLHYKSAAIDQQSIAGMAPPLLIDYQTGRSINQMPAIVFYLAAKLDLMPENAFDQALMLKIVLDANDVLSDLTNANGTKMWQYEQWQGFRKQRLRRWLDIFSQNLASSKVQDEYVFGHQISAADLAIFALFGTIMRCFPTLQEDIATHAPRIAALCQRILEIPSIKAWQQAQQVAMGDLYCGGQIEASIREMLKRDSDSPKPQ